MGTLTKEDIVRCLKELKTMKDKNMQHLMADALLVTWARDVDVRQAYSDLNLDYGEVIKEEK